jgi:hypothetical protein
VNNLLNNLLVVVKLSSSDFPLSQAILAAHRMAGDEPFFVDLPGVDNPRWQDARRHPVGRMALLYGSVNFCNRVEHRLRELQSSVKDNQVFAVVSRPTAELALGPFWDGTSLVRVRRKALRKASDAGAARAAERLRRHLESCGKPTKHPIVLHPRYRVDADGRWAAIVNAGTPNAKIERHLLRLQSSSGHHFVNRIWREPGAGTVFSGARDAYGFAAGEDGGLVPDFDEAALFRAFIGEEDNA